MNTTDLVHFPLRDLPGDFTPSSHSPLAPSRYELDAPARHGVLCAREYLAAGQRVDGSWAGQTIGEISSLTQFVLLYAFLGREQWEVAEQAARTIRREQREDGGWARTPGGPFDLDVSVLAYFALKVVGEDACGQEMARARRAIRTQGGADRCNSETRAWLALLGQIDYVLCTPVVPEWLLSSTLSQSPSWVDENELAARSVIWALRPRRELEMSRGIRELFVEPPRNWQPAKQHPDWPVRRIARIWSRCERSGFVPFRRRALERARFLLGEKAAESFDDTGDLVEVARRWIALSALGFPESSRAIKACDGRVRSLVAVDEIADEARSQPHTTLTADTSLVIQALAVSGFTSDHPAVADGLSWMLNHRADLLLNSRRPKEMTAILEAFSAALESEKSQAAGALPELRIAPGRSTGCTAENATTPSSEVMRQYCETLARNLIRAQRPDGGWSTDCAFSNVRFMGINHGSNDRRGASSPDVTGVVVAAFPPECHSYRAAASRAVSILRLMQRADGSWESGSGGQFIHGTANAVRGLLAVGVDCDDQAVAAGINWLLVNQHEFGGWGEAAGDIANVQFQAVEPTVIQTAWAIIALVAAGLADHDATRRGVAFLLHTQVDDGGWRETQLVERDSPRGPWYRNDLHTTSWALLALTRWAVATAGEADESTATLRLVCHEA